MTPKRSKKIWAANLTQRLKATGVAWHPRVKRQGEAAFSLIQHSSAAETVVAILTPRDKGLAGMLQAYKHESGTDSLVVVICLEGIRQSVDFADVEVDLTDLPAWSHRPILEKLGRVISEKRLPNILVGSFADLNVAATMKWSKLPVLGWIEEGHEVTEHEAFVELARTSDVMVGRSLATCISAMDALEFRLPLAEHPRLLALEDEQNRLRDFRQVLQPAPPIEKLVVHSFDRYHEVEAILRHQNVVRRMPAIDTDLTENRLNIIDGPKHKELRSMVQPMFTPKGMEALRDDIRREVRHQFKTIAALNEVNLGKDLCQPLNLTILSNFIGMPRTALKDLEHLGAKRIRRMLPNFPNVQLNETHFFRQLHKQVEGWLQIEHPPERSILRLLKSNHNLKDPGTKIDAGNLISSIITAGLHATNAFLLQVTEHIVRQPKVLDALRRAPEEIPAAVEEFLRFYSTTEQLVWLRAAEDFNFAGQTIHKGDRFRVHIKKANRDLAVFEDPETFDWRLGRKRHLAFGIGIHHCLGAWLVKAQTEILLEEWARADESVWPQNLSLTDSR
jgi:cytochrome P450